MTGVRRLKARDNPQQCRLAASGGAKKGDEFAFEPKRYWRGPVWAIINWMIAEGLARHRQDALAARLRRATAMVITRGGFAEYFDPMTGAPLGGDAFSWTASIALVLSDCGLEKNPVTAAAVTID